MTITTMYKVSRMKNMIALAGERVHGGRPYADVAYEWIHAGVTVEQAREYIEAGCWDADRVADLIAAGITAEQLVDDDVAAAITQSRDWASRQRGGPRLTEDDLKESIAYLHSNRDIGTDEILQAVRS